MKPAADTIPFSDELSDKSHCDGVIIIIMLGKVKKSLLFSLTTVLLWILLTLRTPLFHLWQLIGLSQIETCNSIVHNRNLEMNIKLCYWSRYLKRKEPDTHLLTSRHPQISMPSHWMLGLQHPFCANHTFLCLLHHLFPVEAFYVN